MRFRLAAAVHLLIAIALPVCSQAQDEPEGTLPPVIVRPDPEPVPSLGEVESDSQAFDPSLNNPSLSDLQLGSSDGFGDQTGILRGRASLFDTPAAASVTTREQIIEKQSSDMFHALQNEVGVLMQSTASGQASPFVRGLTGQQVLILVDGIRLNNSTFRFGPNQYFNTIDPGMVDHIEVLRGQGSVLWGSDAIGGAINVVTRGPDVHQRTCHGDYSGAEFSEFYNTSNSSSYSRLNVEGWVGQLGVFSGGSYQDVHNLDTGHAFGRQPGTNYSQYAGDIKFNYLLDETQLLTVSLQHHELEDVPRSDRFPGYPGDLNGSNTPGGARFFDPQQRDLAYIRYQAVDPIPAIDALTVTASYHRQREVQTRGMPVTTRFQETDVDTVGINAIATRDNGDFGKWTAGVDWYHDDVDSSFGGSASGPIIPDDAYYERIGTFLNWDVSLTERLDAVACVRYEDINLSATPSVGGTPIFISPSYQDWVAQLGLVYELTPCVHLVGSVSEGFRAPNLDELTANNPNVLQDGMDLPSLGLIPERSINYEVGVKTNFDRLRTQSFVYWIDLDNNIVPISAGSNLFRRANQDSLIQGVEFDGELLLRDGWSVYGNFWYTYGINEVTSSPLSRIPPTQGIAGLRWRDQDSNSYFAIYTWLVGRQDRLDPVRDISDERIPPGGTPGYGTLNLRLGRAFGACNQHRASLSLENLTDKDYLVHGSGVFGTGFTARLGYTWVH
jgi:outer membrane receptor protein involved in Fe transport